MAGSRSALIVATYRYQDERLRMLKAPLKDADALSEVLGDPAIGGFDVRTVLNQSAHEIQIALGEFFADRRPDDVLLAHFSCHGVKDDSGELFLAATDTRVDLLDATAVPSSYVNKVMTRSRSGSVVLLLDCCYAGAFARGMTRAGGDVDLTDRFGGRGRAVITASTALQYAFEGDDTTTQGPTKPSVFTRALVEGLRTGEADRNSDGIVSLDELYAHVHDEVTRQNPDQTPQKWLFDVAGDLHVARRATPVTVPSELPRELESSMYSLLDWQRLAVVQPLQSLLLGSHPGVALAARLALEELAENDDSLRVREAASVALASAPSTRQQVSTPPPPCPGPTVRKDEKVDRADASPGSRIVARDSRRGLLLSVAGGALALAVTGVGVALLLHPGDGTDRPTPPPTLSPTTLLLTTGFGGPVMSFDTRTGAEPQPMPIGDGGGPSISGDRQWLTYLEWRPEGAPIGTGTVPHVVRVNGEDDSVVQGTGGAACPTTLRPAWSPDSENLAMICKGESGQRTVGLAVGRAHGPGVHIILDQPIVCCGVTWMGNDRIVVGETTPDGRSDLVVVSTTGDELARLDDPGRSLHDPDWSEEGGLAYVRTAPQQPGGGTVMVVRGPVHSPAEAWTPADELASHPTWAPGATQLAYLKQLDATTRELDIAAAPMQGQDSGVPRGQLGDPAWGSR